MISVFNHVQKYPKCGTSKAENKQTNPKTGGCSSEDHNFKAHYTNTGQQCDSRKAYISREATHNSAY